MKNQGAGIEELISIISDLNRKLISVEEFCVACENLINFNLDFSILSETQKAVVEDLFGVVTRYSPYVEDRDSYIFYSSDEDVIFSAKKALPYLSC